MLKNQKYFIQRQIKWLAGQNLPPEEILQKSLTILDDTAVTNQAIKDYKNSKNLITTLNQLEIIQLDTDLIPLIEKSDRETPKNISSIITLLDTNETISQTFSLLKARLSAGLSYALWLSIVAVSVLSIISLKVLPQFEEIFDGFGAELPAATKLALAWQDSFFSPTLIGGIFIIFITFLLISVHLLKKHNNPNPLLFYIPFIRGVIQFTSLLQWLTHVQLLNAAGYSIQKCFEKLLPEPALLNKYMPYIKSELITAEKIGNLNTEFNFQTNHLNLLAEDIITKAARNLIALVMVFVVSYVMFTIFASYLPIFQLGAVV